MFGEAGPCFGSNPLHKGAGTWARDVLTPERRQVGMVSPLFQPSASVDGRRAGSHGTPLGAKGCMLGEHALLVRSSQHESRSGLNNSAENQPG